ncbi:hypothetical protein [Bacillus sp. 7894-2]|uniref:hypothetical protein n=1 Tax=Bacillus sp. 7894-2 TaxID=2021695 RepID=UPI0015CBA1BC|nr:hypothetical protein [Bacillus sp. 7894-2]
MRRLIGLILAFLGSFLASALGDNVWMILPSAMLYLGGVMSGMYYAEKELKSLFEEVSE